MGGQVAAPVLIPRFEPAPAAGGTPRPTLRRGASGEPVSNLQLLIGDKVDGRFGGRTEAARACFSNAARSRPRRDSRSAQLGRRWIGH